MHHLAQPKEFPHVIHFLYHPLPVWSRTFPQIHCLGNVLSPDTCHISGFGPRPNGDGELPKFFVPLLSIFWKFHQAKRLNARSPGDCDIAPGECSRLGRLLCYGAGRSFRDGHREP